MTKRKFVWFLALAWLALAAQPGLAAEQKAFLYEVTEAMKLNSMQQGIYRTATASLMGSVEAGNSICPAWLAAAYGKAECAIVATARDSVDLATGQGPVRGTFKVVIQGDNLVDGPELVVAEGAFNGTVDLGPALLGPDGKPQSGDELPLGSLTGRWKASGARGGPLEGASVHGTLTGTFRMPFALPQALDPKQTPLYLMDPATQQVVPVHAAQYSLGIPTVMLEITFVEKH